MKRKFYQWAVLLTCSALAACSSTKDPQPVVYLDRSAEANQWIADQEVVLRESIKGSPFTLRKEQGKWIVTAPAGQSFNPDRPGLLLPVVLGPITRIAKTLEGSPDSAVLILGHTDLTGDGKASHQLSADRARAVASIFRLSGLKGGRMMHMGMGSSHTLDQVKNNAQNHRVEIIITHNTQMQGVMAMYHPAYVRQLALSQAK